MLRRFLCWALGGHDLGAVPVWKDGRARLRCQYDCGYHTAGIAAAQTRPLPPRPRRLRIARRVA